jgi:cytoplasmic iron level regulating protein YaaA (DUF328/UPF0246 family)
MRTKETAKIFELSEENCEKKIGDLTVNEFQLLINKTVHEAFEELSEDILALSSSEYRESIKEARNNFKEGEVKTFKEVFDV